jgi:hypothetical protein
MFFALQPHTLQLQGQFGDIPFAEFLSKSPLKMPAELTFSNKLFDASSFLKLQKKQK